MHSAVYTTQKPIIPDAAPRGRSTNTLIGVFLANRITCLFRNTVGIHRDFINETVNDFYTCHLGTPVDKK